MRGASDHLLPRGQATLLINSITVALFLLVQPISTANENKSLETDESSEEYDSEYNEDDTSIDIRPMRDSRHRHANLSIFTTPESDPVLPETTTSTTSSGSSAETTTDEEVYTGTFKYAHNKEDYNYSVVTLPTIVGTLFTVNIDEWRKTKGVPVSSKLPKLLDPSMMKYFNPRSNSTNSREYRRFVAWANKAYKSNVTVSTTPTAGPVTPWTLYPKEFDDNKAFQTYMAKNWATTKVARRKQNESAPGEGHDWLDRIAAREFHHKPWRNRNVSEDQKYWRRRPSYWSADGNETGPWRERRPYWAVEGVETYRPWRGGRPHWAPEGNETYEPRPWRGRPSRYWVAEGNETVMREDKSRPWRRRGPYYWAAEGNETVMRKYPADPRWARKRPSPHYWAAVGNETVMKELAPGSIWTRGRYRWSEEVNETARAEWRGREYGPPPEYSREFDGPPPWDDREFGPPPPPPPPPRREWTDRRDSREFNARYESREFEPRRPMEVPPDDRRPPPRDRDDFDRRPDDRGPPPPRERDDFDRRPDDRGPPPRERDDFDRRPDDRGPPPRERDDFDRRPDDRGPPPQRERDDFDRRPDDRRPPPRERDKIDDRPPPREKDLDKRGPSRDEDRGSPPSDAKDKPRSRERDVDERGPSRGRDRFDDRPSRDRYADERRPSRGRKEFDGRHSDERRPSRGRKEFDDRTSRDRGGYDDRRPPYRGKQEQFRARPMANRSSSEDVDSRRLGSANTSDTKKPYFKERDTRYSTREFQSRRGGGADNRGRGITRRDRDFYDRKKGESTPFEKRTTRDTFALQAKYYRQKIEQRREKELEHIEKKRKRFWRPTESDEGVAEMSSSTTTIKVSTRRSYNKMRKQNLADGAELGEVGYWPVEEEEEAETGVTADTDQKETDAADEDFIRPQPKLRTRGQLYDWITTTRSPEEAGTRTATTGPDGSTTEGVTSEKPELKGFLKNKGKKMNRPVTKKYIGKKGGKSSGKGGKGGKKKKN